MRAHDETWRDRDEAVSPTEPRPHETSPAQPRRLDPSGLRRRCNVSSLAFATTDDLEPFLGPLNQARAAEATERMVAMRAPGYNLFVVGPPGVGKHEVITALLERAAADQAPPDDWCYVHDFERHRHPRALRIPHGRGCDLVADVHKLIGDLAKVVRAGLDSADFRTRAHEIKEQFEARVGEVVNAVATEAKARGLALVRMEGVVAFGALRGDHVLTSDEFDALPPEERARLGRDTAELHEKLREGLRPLPDWAQESGEKLEQLKREVTEHAVSHAIAQIKERWRDVPDVCRHLDAVRADVVAHADDFREEPKNELLASLGDSGDRARYDVNLLVAHAGTAAPVVYEDQPGCEELVGRIEHRAVLGNLVSDFTLIRSGALHRANGGYLILDADKLLRRLHAWDALKRALFSSRIQVEALSRMLGLGSHTTLEPEPIPLDVKVVLIGERPLFSLLAALDPDVSALFKLVAEFDDRMDRDAAGESLYARTIAGLIDRFGLRPCDRSAVAKLIEESSRLAEDGSKLSTSLRMLEALLREAVEQARRRDATTVIAADVERAVEARERMRDLARERMQEDRLRSRVMVDTSGRCVGQVNGLAIHSLGDYRFGLPTRITATVRVGDGTVVDIEREAELSGPIHTKGVLILSSYLASRYARQLPLSLWASLVFEQSYGGVEGDSASLAELCALLSALAGVPVRQDLAITGSVNQLGQVQAVGGVNEKIEGFFELCRARGLTGEQGVIMPATNQPHLMLRPELVEVAAEGRFHVHVVETVDQAIELLTGELAGEPDEEGEFPAGTLSARVVTQLRAFARAQRRHGAISTRRR